MRFRHGSKVLVGLCFGVFGCGSEASDPSPDLMGFTGKGGVYGTGGLSGTGGLNGNGGATVQPSGGAGGFTPPATGGQPPVGTGGSVSGTGGQVGATGGTTQSTGGAMGSGGAIGSGGAVSTGGATGSGGGPGPGGACLNGITDFGKAGPFQVAQKTVGSVKFWAPTVPAGCKVPIVHLANGTGATCGTYAAALTRLATHGFIGCCYENANTGAGTQGIEAIDTALKTYPDIADKRFGSTGHSQGGQASFVVMALAEKKYGADGVYAGLALQPASGFGTQPAGGWQTQYKSIKGPMFMFSGAGSDGLVSQSWVQQAYDAMDKGTETYFWTKQGSTHIPVPNGEAMQISIPWFRWKLLGDQKACTAFKDILKTDTTWKQVAAQNEKPCN